MKCNQSRPGFELVSPCPFPRTVTITPRAPPLINNKDTFCVEESATPFLDCSTLPSVLYNANVKQGGIKYHFLSLWYDSTWDWTLVPQTIGEHSKPNSKTDCYVLGKGHKTNMINMYLERKINVIYQGKQVIQCRQDSFCYLPSRFAQSAGAVEYTDCFPAEG